MNTWGETMGKNKNKRNKNNNVQIHEISTGDEGTRLIKIIVVILVLFAIFYFLTGYVSRYMNRRENQIDNTPETAIIQYDKIMIGEILNQTPEEYYVLLHNQDDFYQSVYDLYISEYENVGDHLEDSGSAPLKKVRAGEVAIGFGLRQQAVADKADGLPIDYIDPAEGNFSLTESVAVVDKGDDTNPLAMEMAQCIIENGREELQSYYPNALYNGESTDAANKSANPKVFPEKLTVDLLEQHQAISEAAKEEAGL